jgi:iron complex outermembrane receptor protein
MVARPFKGTTLHAALEYVNAKYTDFTFEQAAAVTLPGSTGCSTSASSLPPSAIGPFVSINCSGKPLVRSPRWAGNAGISQVLELGGDQKLTFDADIDFASSRYTSTSFVANSRVNGYGNVSLSLTYTAPSDRWFISGYLRNVTNAKVYTGGGGDEAPTVPGYVTSTIGAPRTYGARFGVKF